MLPRDCDVQPVTDHVLTLCCSVPGAPPTNDVCHAAGTQLVLGLVELALLPTQHVYDGPGTSWDWIRRLGGVSAPAAKLSLLAYVVAFASMALALRWMTSAADKPRPVLPVSSSSRVSAYPGFCHHRHAMTPLNIIGEAYAGVVLSLFKQQSPQHDELSMECFNWLKVRS